MFAIGDEAREASLKRRKRGHHRLLPRRRDNRDEQPDSRRRRKHPTLGEGARSSMIGMSNQNTPIPPELTSQIDDRERRAFRDELDRPDWRHGERSSCRPALKHDRHAREHQRDEHYEDAITRSNSSGSRSRRTTRASAGYRARPR
jgi:hypothetical protein